MLTSYSIPNLIQGVSQQSDAQRDPTQRERTGDRDPGIRPHCLSFFERYFASLGKLRQQDTSRNTKGPWALLNPSL
jgi:hypothetical protein